MSDSDRKDSLQTEATCKPPGYRHGFQAHLLKRPDDSVVQAVWLQFDNVWVINGHFISAKMAANMGYTYSGLFSEDAS